MFSVPDDSAERSHRARGHRWIWNSRSLTAEPTSADRCERRGPPPLPAPSQLCLAITDRGEARRSKRQPGGSAPRPLPPAASRIDEVAPAATPACPTSPAPMLLPELPCEPQKRVSTTRDVTRHCTGHCKDPPCRRSARPGQQWKLRRREAEPPLAARQSPRDFDAADGTREPCARVLGGAAGGSGGKQRCRALGRRVTPPGPPHEAAAAQGALAGRGLRSRNKGSVLQTPCA